MPFTLTQLSRAPGWTRTDLLADIATMAAGFGWTLYDSYNSAGTEVRVYRYVVNGTAKGTVYMQISVPSNILTTSLSAVMYDTWNAVAHTGTIGISGVSIILTPAAQLNMFGFNSNAGEGQFIYFDSDHSRYPFGWIRPATKHTAYNEATYRFIFMPNASNMLSTTGSSTLEGSSAYSISSYLLSTGNTVYDSGYRQVSGCKVLYRNSSTCGVIGYFSDDWAEIASSNLSFGDIVRDIANPSDRYFVTATSGGNLALRLA